jgi:hypothetical protein
LHGLLLFVHARHTPKSSAASATRAPELIEVEAPDIEAAPEPTSTSSNGEPAARTASVASVSAQHAVHAAATAAAEASADSAPSEATSENGSSAPGPPSAVASSEAPARKIDLGLDGNFFMRPPSEELPRVHKSEFQHQLEASIAADNLKHGLARGNAFVGSLNSAVREAGPTRGEALFRITLNADGALTDVEFLRGTPVDWAPAIASFRALASRKRARIPSGAHGLRVTFSVKAKVALPSGKETNGVDVASPSLAPNGLVPHGTFDLADIGSNPERLVYAHVVSEEVL